MAGRAKPYVVDDDLWAVVAPLPAVSSGIEGGVRAGWATGYYPVVTTDNREELIMGQPVVHFEVIGTGRPGRRDGLSRSVQSDITSYYSPSRRLPVLGPAFQAA